MTTYTHDPRTIQVSGLDVFPVSRWREAILTYVFGVLSGTPAVMSKPTFTVGSIGLTLDKERGVYSVSGLQTSYTAPNVDGSAMLRVGASKVEVEHALLRFVKNNSISVLVITLPVLNHVVLEEGPLMAELRLWKGHQRNFLGIRWDFVCSLP